MKLTVLKIIRNWAGWQIDLNENGLKMNFTASVQSNNCFLEETSSETRGSSWGGGETGEGGETMAGGGGGGREKGSLLHRRQQKGEDRKRVPQGYDDGEKTVFFSAHAQSQSGNPTHL